MSFSEKLNLKDTLTCGQCFRASYSGTAWTVKAGTDENVKVLTVSQNELLSKQNVLQENKFWFDYFDLAADYEKMKKTFSNLSPLMQKACNFAPGIRILRQDSWEALASFVVSQNNNIKRIMHIIENLCSNFGKKNNEGVSGFPCAKTLASVPLDKLRASGLGFRDEYIKQTAKAVLDGKLDFEEIKKADINEARKILMSIKGIGPKVADCALLFGFHRLDCFPMDVWMKRVMNLYFNNNDGRMFGEYRGLAQQYLFHWIRNNNDL